jgi:hypothetical protein
MLFSPGLDGCEREAVGADPKRADGHAASAGANNSEAAGVVVVTETFSPRKSSPVVARRMVLIGGDGVAALL